MTKTNFIGLVAAHNPSDIYSSDFFLIRDEEFFNELNERDLDGNITDETLEKLDEMLGMATSEEPEDIKLMKTAPYEHVLKANGYYIGELYYKLAKNRGIEIDSLESGGGDVFLRVKDILMGDNNITEDNYIYVDLID